MVGDKKLQRDGGGKVGRVSRVSSISKVSMVESKAIGEEKKQSIIYKKVKCCWISNIKVRHYNQLVTFDLFHFRHDFNKRTWKIIYSPSNH